jgi:hypothetical protein
VAAAQRDSSKAANWLLALKLYPTACSCSLRGAESTYCKYQSESFLISISRISSAINFASALPLTPYTCWRTATCP